MISGSYSSFWFKYHDTSTEASVHACSIFVCLGLYLGYLLMDLAQAFRIWSGDHTAHLGGHIMGKAHKLVCMQCTIDSCVIWPISWLPVDQTCSIFQIIIRGSYTSFWCRYHVPSTHASVVAHLILMCLGLYPGGNRSDQIEWGLNRIREKCWSFCSTSLDPCI